MGGIRGFEDGIREFGVQIRGFGMVIRGFSSLIQVFTFSTQFDALEMMSFAAANDMAIIARVIT